MIIVSGFNVFPSELENTVSLCPGVLECAVIGVPDEKAGEAIKLFIIKKDANLNEEDVKAYCSQNLTAYKMPKYIVFRDDLPKTNVGKILRRELRVSKLNIKRELTSSQLPFLCLYKLRSTQQEFLIDITTYCKRLGKSS
jgi:acyl-CoA synthetase (AMP-forming)/AMP-acid ligase II